MSKSDVNKRIEITYSRTIQDFEELPMTNQDIINKLMRYSSEKSKYYNERVAARDKDNTVLKSITDEYEPGADDE